MAAKHKDCVLYVGKNGKYCYNPDKTVCLNSDECMIVTLLNVEGIDVLQFPTNDTDDATMVVDTLSAGSTTIYGPGVFKLDTDCAELEDTVAPEDKTLHQIICCTEIKKSLATAGGAQVNAEILATLESLCQKMVVTNGELSDLCAKILAGNALTATIIQELQALCDKLEDTADETVAELQALCKKLESLIALTETANDILTNIEANTKAITGIETSLGQIGCTEDEEGNITGSVLVCKVSDTTTDPITDTIKVWWFGLDGTVVENYTGPYVACTNLQALANLLQKICDKLDSVIEECCYVVDGGLTETARCQTFARTDPFGNGSPDTNYFVRVNGQQIDLPNPHTHADILAALNGVCGNWQILDDGNGRQVLCNTDLSCTSAVFGQCTDQGLNFACSLATSAGIIVEPNVTCRRFIRTWGKFEEPIADTLATSLAVQEDMLACLQADKGPQCTEQTFGPLSDCIFSDDPAAEIVTASTDVYVDIKTCDGIPEEPFIYTLAGAVKEPYELQGELANQDKTLFEPALECPDVPYEAATIQRKLNILDNSLWDNAPAVHIGIGDFPRTDIEVAWTDGSTSVFNWPGGTGLYGGFRAWLLEESGCLVANVLANWPRFPTNLPWGLTDEDVPRECLFARGWSLMCCVGSKCMDKATVIASDNADWIGASKTAWTFDGPLETIYVGHVGCNVIYKDCDGNLIELPDGCCPLPTTGGAGLDDFKGVKTGGIAGADYDSMLCYINGRPVANVPWEWFGPDGSIIRGETLEEFISNAEAVGYTEFSVGEQHYICPVPASYTEPGSHYFEADGNTVSKPESIALTSIEGAPSKTEIENQCYLRVLDCNSDQMLAALSDLQTLQSDANEMASDALIKDCLLSDEILNQACDAALTETLDKEAGELCLEGDVADTYEAGGTIALKNALGDICGEAIVADVDVPAVYNEEEDKTTVKITDCELAEGKTPVQIKTAKPVLQATVAAVKAVVTQVSILQAKTLVTAQAIRTPVKVTDFNGTGFLSEAGAFAVGDAVTLMDEGQKTLGTAVISDVSETKYAVRETTVAEADFKAVTLATKR